MTACNLPGFRNPIARWAYVAVLLLVPGSLLLLPLALVAVRAAPRGPGAKRNTGLRILVASASRSS